MFELPKLPYTYDALEPIIDKETMILHHSKHHQTYLDKFKEQLRSVEHKTISIGKLLKQLNNNPKENKILINNGGGYYNHTFFWYCMSPESSETDINNELREMIDRDFGSLQDMKKQFNQDALKIFGSGWQWLCYNPENKKLVLKSSVNQFNPGFTSNEIPILACDVWEHAYYLKYNNRRGEYLDSWWNVVDYKNLSMFYELFAKQGKIVDFVSNGTILVEE
ncbi:Manganese superoxide dismutase [Spraguea lophii 42_110]|uniref:Superoxide dismutase n=1 Tax=Spraguea lophii (strain 42_110) TaxID=1358809 RepID=S7XSL1_SPRLO|nr:Manganese superoxide dismutase [Spraguea lophii 42_110]